MANRTTKARFLGKRAELCKISLSVLESEKKKKKTKMDKTLWRVRAGSGRTCRGRSLWEPNSTGLRKYREVLLILKSCT